MAKQENILVTGGDMWAVGRNYGRDVAKAFCAWFAADAVESNAHGDEWTIYRYGKNVTLRMPDPKQSFQKQQEQLQERMWKAKKQLDTIAT